MQKSEFNELLKNNTLLVKFTKNDGSIRELKCTLKPEVMEGFKGATGSVRKVPENQVCCIDIELNAFRSFIIESVIEYSIL